MTLLGNVRLTVQKQKDAQKFYISKTWYTKRPFGHRVALPNLIKFLLSLKTKKKG